MELEKTNLALLKGLNFTAIQLHIDASVASGDRSLSKTETALQWLSDYRSFELSCVIKFSAQTHPDFLDRLFNLLEISRCKHIEVLSQKSGPTSLQDRMASQNQLVRINQHFQDCGWRGCGNNNFFAPSHGQATLSQQSKFEATPWGYMSRNIPLSLGFGIAALSLDAGRYQYNTPSSERYVSFLIDKKLPVQSHFCLAANKTVNFRLIQKLLCEHTVTPSSPQLHRRLTSLSPREWLKEEDDSLT
jgi:hypothetical protein